MNSRWILAKLDEQLANLTQNLSTQIHDEEGTELSVQEIRHRLSDPDFPHDQKNRYLRALVQRSRASGGAWQSAVTSVMLPNLRRLARNLSRYERIEPDEADSEILASFMQALITVDPEIEDLEAHLCRTSSRSAARSLRNPYREAAVEDIELVGALRADQDPVDVITEAAAKEMNTSKRISPSNQQQVEGERFGAIIHRLGIHERLQTPLKHGAPIQDMSSHAKRRMRTNRLTIPELFDLPAIVDLQTAANAIGISIGTAYKLVHQNQFPCPVLRPGYRYKVPTAGLMKCLRIEDTIVSMDDVDRGVSFALEES